MSLSSHQTLTLALALTLAVSPAFAQPSPEPSDPPVRGVTISTHGIGRDWGTDNIVRTMQAIRGVGATWVATHPYAGIRGDGTVRVRGFSDGEPAEYLVRPIREAHALGLKILIKPHLAYWGSPFRWRGEIQFDNDEEWDRFFDGYRRWIVELAKVCKDADGFVIGTELDRTFGHEQRWRELIRAVREQTEAPLTYAANWSDYQQVPFWDALDVVGIQAYFPLTEERDPSEADLQKAWATRMTELRGFSAKSGKHIVFTELGYNRAHLAPVQPWDSRTDGPDAQPIQLACMQAALRAVEAEPAVVGAFLWKWFTWPNRRGGNFRLDTPEMKEAVGDVWR